MEQEGTSRHSACLARASARPGFRTLLLLVEMATRAGMAHGCASHFVVKYLLSPSGGLTGVVTANDDDRRCGGWLRRSASAGAAAADDNLKQHSPAGVGACDLARGPDGPGGVSSVGSCRRRGRGQRSETQR